MERLPGDESYDRSVPSRNLPSIPGHGDGSYVRDTQTNFEIYSAKVLKLFLPWNYLCYYDQPPTTSQFVFMKMIDRNAKNFRLYHHSSTGCIFFPISFIVITMSHCTCTCKKNVTNKKKTQRKQIHCLPFVDFPSGLSCLGFVCLTRKSTLKKTFSKWHENYSQKWYKLFALCRFVNHNNRVLPHHFLEILQEVCTRLDIKKHLTLTMEMFGPLNVVQNNGDDKVSVLLPHQPQHTSDTQGPLCEITKNRNKDASHGQPLEKKIFPHGDSSQEKFNGNLKRCQNLSCTCRFEDRCFL